MNRIFIISDTHFGHKKIVGYEPNTRPFNSIEEHDEHLVTLWNSTVKPKDTVWHLGDVLFGRAAFATLKRLNGVKKLVMGNHDRYPSALYLEHFNAIFGAAEVHNCVLTHIPVTDAQKYRFRGNIHGHMHQHTLPDPWYVNVSAEQTGLAPILLDEVIVRLPIKERHT